MKPIIITLFTLLSFSVASQIQEPVVWSFDFNDLGNQEYELIFSAEIEKGWKIYSQYLESDDGPVRTSFFYDQPDEIELLGPNEESGKIKEGYEELFEMTVISIAQKATFSQKIRYTGDQPVIGYLEFMACNDEMCLPPSDVSFSFTLPVPLLLSGKKSRRFIYLTDYD